MDPNAPKRPANAFIMFCELQRELIKEERHHISKINPGSEQDGLLSNLTKALGTKWRNLAEIDRKFYQDMFREQVMKYDTEIAEYLKEHPDAPLEDADIHKLPSNWTDPNAPKRPTNPFFVFCESEDQRLVEQRSVTKTKEELEKDLEKVSKSFAERWRLLSDEERKGNVNLN